MIYLGHSWGAVVSKKNYNNWLPFIVWLNAKTGTKKKEIVIFPFQLPNAVIKKFFLSNKISLNS